MFSSKPILIVLAVSGLLMAPTFAQKADSNTGVIMYFQQAKIKELEKVQFSNCNGNVKNAYGERTLQIPLCKNENNILKDNNNNKLTLKRDSTLTPCDGDSECAHLYATESKIYYNSEYCASSKMHDILTKPESYRSVTISAGIGHYGYLYMLVECNTQSKNSD